jgi:hypothetical protein
LIREKKKPYIYIDIPRASDEMYVLLQNYFHFIAILSLYKVSYRARQVCIISTDVSNKWMAVYPMLNLRRQ